VDLGVDDQDDAAAPAPVSTVGPTEGFELLAVHRSAAVAAVTGLRMDDHTVDEPGHIRSFLKK
jgi:hypothetical protein